MKRRRTEHLYEKKDSRSEHLYEKNDSRSEHLYEKKDSRTKHLYEKQDSRTEHLYERRIPGLNIGFIWRPGDLTANGKETSIFMNYVYCTE